MQVKKTVRLSFIDGLQYPRFVRIVADQDMSRIWAATTERNRIKVASGNPEKQMLPFIPFP